MLRRAPFLFTLLIVAAPVLSASAQDLAERYEKLEVMIPMRDGVRLSTAIYAPKDRSQAYPFLMKRSPYSRRPYGAEDFPSSLGPNPAYVDSGYIFVYQDVRGCYLSEGTFVNMRPHIDEKTGPQTVDEASDTYDTIQWLLDHVEGHNGRVGMWGISYPGFYAAAGMIDAHPALRAVSPQAPIADWWYDDFHHHGAFFLPHAFNFLVRFGQPRPEPTTSRRFSFEHGTPDGYQFFLDLGPLRNANPRYLKGQIAFWDAIVAHPNRDAFWQARDLLPHLQRVAPAVMTVGGWFDAEDLYGPLNIYREVEQANPDVFNVLVMGPWRHGGWVRGDGDHLGNVDFGSKTSPWYQANLEQPFFEHFLKDRGPRPLIEATVFETGSSRWRQFDHWPPQSVQERELYLRAGGALSFEPPAGGESPYDEYVSDPGRPVPFTEDVAIGMTREYMTDDQRFAARRPDVLVFQTSPLTEDLTLAGPLLAELWVSTSGTDSDWIVKLVDVFPADAPDHEFLEPDVHMGGYQMMVRSEVLRGRFREDPAHPTPFEPGVPTRVVLKLQDVLHTFQKGHRAMIQVQSTWFPLVDRNPQTFVENIYRARESDFVKATQRVYHGPPRASRIHVGVLPSEAR